MIAASQSSKLTNFSNETFENIHHLLKQSKRKKVLNLLLNIGTGRINKPYNDDLNHAWYLVGDIYFKNGEFANAIKAFKKSYEYWSDDGEALWALGNCYSEIRKPSQAKYYFERAIEKLGRKGELIFNLGNIFFDLGNYHQAINLYKEARKRTKQLSRISLKNERIAINLLKNNSKK